MDKDLAEAARELHDEELFETVRRCYCDTNREYLQKQVQIASKYMTEEQKKKLRQMGVSV